MKRFFSILIRLSLLCILLMGIAAWGFFQFGIYHPKPTETVPVLQIDDAPTLMDTDEMVQQKANQPIKVLNYNVQYFAGKDYVFFYDMEGFSGPDIRPSTESIRQTLDNISELIIRENPDVVLLQEMDIDAARTDNADQTQQLLQRLGQRYPYYTEALYWKAAFVPHPKIAGSVGMKLTTLSKFPITKAIRHQLPRIKENPISRAFNFKRAILEAHIQVSKDRSIVFLNTHLDAFAHNESTMLKQVQKVDEVLSALDAQNLPWVIGGDFNLIPPGLKSKLPEHLHDSYADESQLKLLYEKYSAIPALAQLEGEMDSFRDWLTHLPNHPDIQKPDRIIDYFFYNELLQEVPGTGKVIQGTTWTFSDHLPMTAEFLLKQ